MSARANSFRSFRLMAVCCLVAGSVAGGQAVAASADSEDTRQSELVEEEETTEARFNASIETWLYSTFIKLSSDSLLNPGNRLGKVPGVQTLSDTRSNITAEYGPMQVLIQPRLVLQQDQAGTQADESVRADITAFKRYGQLTQFNARLKLDNHTLSLGRELLTWGPSTFRSPSNPYYFDIGRSMPLASTPGVDALRYTYKWGISRWSVARIFSTSQLEGLDASHSNLFKLDVEGDNYLISLNRVKRSGYLDFKGGFVQYSPDEAWMLYGEFGSYRPVTPAAIPDVGVFINRIEEGLSRAGLFQLAPRAGRTSIVGAAYTLENGNLVSAEWMRNEGGLSRREQDRFFNQIEVARSLATANQPLSDALVGLTVLQTPPLLGREYLWLSLQSNPQETKFYWRTEWSQSMTDNSGRALFYIEKSIKPTMNAFVAITASVGGARSDFGAFVNRTFTVGLKFFLY